MATKTFTTDFMLNRKQAVGLEKAMLASEPLQTNNDIKANFYKEGDAGELRTKLDRIFK
jgi:hypothetical protein